MAKKVDITEKLEMDGNPYLVIAGKEVEVAADAATMITLMDKFGGEEPTTVKDVLTMYDAVFPEKSRKTIDALKLSMKDLQTVIGEAMKLIMGEEVETPGEGQTPATT